MISASFDCVLLIALNYSSRSKVNHIKIARVVKLVDTGDSKSPAFAGVPVRVRPLVPLSVFSPFLIILRTNPYTP